MSKLLVLPSDYSQGSKVLLHIISNKLSLKGKEFHNNLNYIYIYFFLDKEISFIQISKFLIKAENL